MPNKKSVTSNLINPILPLGFQISIRDSIMVLEFFNEDSERQEIFSSIALTKSMAENLIKGLHDATKELK